MPSLWKKIKTKLGKKKKDKPLKDVGETGYMQPMSERLTGYSVRMEGSNIFLQSIYPPVF